jgi:NCAIR mutase (PurE)-related protein
LKLGGKMKRYFLYYSFVSKDRKTGQGNTEVRCKKIKCLKDIRDIEKCILEENKEFIQVAISNFIMF